MTLNVTAHIEQDPAHDGILMLRQRWQPPVDRLDEIDVALQDVPELYRVIENATAAVTPAIWYLGSPYSHRDSGVMEGRFRQVCQVAALLFRRSIPVYSPIAHSHPIAMYGQMSETDFEYWRDFDLNMLDRMRGLMVLMLPGWEESRGLSHEIEHARAHGKPVLWIEPVFERRMTLQPGGQAWIASYRMHEEQPEGVERRGVEERRPRLPHKQEIAGSSPAPATTAPEAEDDPLCLTCEDEHWLPNDTAESEDDPVWKPCPECNPRGAIPCPYVYQAIEAEGAQA